MTSVAYHFARSSTFGHTGVGYFQTSFHIELSSNYWGKYTGFRCVYRVNNLPETSNRVQRGGSWLLGYVYDFRAHFNNWGNPSYGHSRGGFRCVYPEKDIYCTIDDTKEGWADAAYELFKSYIEDYDVEFNYSKIRPAGAPLKTNGGYVYSGKSND